MKFTLTSNTPTSIKELIDGAGYLVKNKPVNESVLIRIEHKITAGTKVYYEGCLTDLGGAAFVNDTESNYLDAGQHIEFSITYDRLDSVWLLACCVDTDIFITLF